MDENLKDMWNSSSDSGLPVEYKRRKVSAVRSYPPGCGRKTVLISLSYHEIVASNEVMKSNGAESMSLDKGLLNRFAEFSKESHQLEVKAMMELEEGEIQDSEEEDLNEGEFKGLGKQEENHEVMSLMKNEISDGETVSSVKESNDVELQVRPILQTVASVENKSGHQIGVICDVNILEGSGFKNKYPSRRISATRKFPRFCGRNAPRPTEEDRRRIIGYNRVTKVEKFGVESGVLREKIRAGPAESEANSEDRYVHKSESKLIVSDSRKKPHMEFKRSDKNATAPEGKFFKKNLICARKSAGSWVGYLKDENEDLVGEDAPDINVHLPPFWPKNSNHGDARNRVRETLRLFHAYCRKILQGEEAKSRKKMEELRTKKKGKEDIRRIDLLAANIVKRKGKEVHKGEQFVGSVPGVEVGDEFLYRVELAIVAVHRLYQAGIDYKKEGNQIVAVSIVASGGYDDEHESADVLIYCGQGGNLVGKNKNPEDQKLEKGNLALKNSISARNPVRVIRGSKETKAAESSDSRTKSGMTYIYDGLYTVEKYWQEMGPHGKLVFKFELRRMSGQPELAWKEVKKSNKFKTREGVCVVDISSGKELFPISAINTINKEKPPTFNYITKMIYPSWYIPNSPKGCDCIGGCVDSKRCLCAAKNGGDFPYTYNGAIVETKPLVYECGPSCKCPPSCYNRVTQHGTKIQLELFKTESKGWGVRSLNSIPSGGFICEYTGELLEDMEAEKKVNDDEYLFDIGQNYSDCCLSADFEVMDQDDGAFTIDAVKHGNVGRFINHSCSPNLYAQNVLYDHEDKRMPHIMLFAVENIPPLVELNYHYNYKVDQIYDSNGNIKVKRCYCGSKACSGRMY